MSDIQIVLLICVGVGVYLFFRTVESIAIDGFLFSPSSDDQPKETTMKYFAFVKNTAGNIQQTKEGTYQECVEWLEKAFSNQLNFHIGYIGKLEYEARRTFAPVTITKIVGEPKAETPVDMKQLERDTLKQE